MATTNDSIALEEVEEAREVTDRSEVEGNNPMTSSVQAQVDTARSAGKCSDPLSDLEGPASPKPVETARVPAYSVFTKRQKWATVLMAASSAFFSPISATIFLPALTDIANDLNVSINAINTTVTVYMVFQGLSPSLWGRWAVRTLQRQRLATYPVIYPLSMADVLGRRPLYLITLFVYICANIGLALTEVYWLLMVLRCVQATGSASMIALSQGTVADIASPSERGGMVAIANSGAMLAPAIGPVIGSLLVRKTIIAARY